MTRWARWIIVYAMAVVLLTGCLPAISKEDRHVEVPPMLDVLTNVAQSALEQGYFDGNEAAVVEYIRKRKPNIYNWFNERDYRIRVKAIANVAVVLICSKNRPIFEDTYCRSGPPDRDYTETQGTTACEFTMTSGEILIICP